MEPLQHQNGPLEEKENSLKKNSSFGGRKQASKISTLH